MGQPIDEQYYEVIKKQSFAERVLVSARNQMYLDFMRFVKPSPDTTILDVGVSDTQVMGANWLENVYPHSSQLHACGLGEGRDFKRAFPTIEYTKIGPNIPLPYANRFFDVATSNAVLEHVGSAGNQSYFISELTRVARTVFVTVPHRYFPIEHHTGIPILHYNDFAFRMACQFLRKQYWVREENLILMTLARLRDLAPSGSVIGYTGLKIGPVSSNLYLYFSDT